AADLVVYLPKPARLLAPHLVEDHGLRPTKGQLSREHLVQHDAHAIDIGTGIGTMGLTTRLLRTHVGDGTQKLSLNGQDIFNFGTQGKTEVDDDGKERIGLTSGRQPMEERWGLLLLLLLMLCLIRLCGNSSSGHHDVAWLDVAVNKAHRMS